MLANPYRHVHLEGDTATAAQFLPLADNLLRGLRRVGAQYGLTALAKQVAVSRDVSIKVYYCDTHDFLQIKVAGGDGYFVIGDENGVDVVYGSASVEQPFHAVGNTGGVSGINVPSLIYLGQRQALAENWATDYAHLNLLRTLDAGKTFTALTTLGVAWRGDYMGTTAVTLPLGIVTGSDGSHRPGLLFGSIFVDSDGHYKPYNSVSFNGGTTWTQQAMPAVDGVDHGCPALKNLDTQRLVGWLPVLPGASTAPPFGLTSNDAGKTWTLVDSSALWQALPAPVNNTVQAAANAFVASSQIVYLGAGRVIMTGPWNNTLQSIRSTDWGNTWTVAPVVVAPADWPGAAVNFTVALTGGVALYVGPSQNNTLVKTRATFDGGATWRDWGSLPLGAGGRAGVPLVLSPMVMDPFGTITQAATVVVPVYDGSGYWVMRSTDSGQTWQRAAPIPTTAAAADPSAPVLTRFGRVGRFGTPALPAKLDYVFPNNYDDRYSPV